MINSSQVVDIVKKYDKEHINIAVLGSHSALEVMDGCVDESIRTICICQKGRETPYLRFKRLSNSVIVLNRFIDILNPESQKKLRDLNVLMIAHRAFSVYIGYDNIENKNLVIAEFSAPIWVDKDRIIEIVKEAVSIYITVLEVTSISRFDD